MRRPGDPTWVMLDTLEDKLSYEHKGKCMERAPNCGQHLHSVGQVVSTLCGMGKLLSLSESQLHTPDPGVREGFLSFPCSLHFPVFSYCKCALYTTVCVHPLVLRSSWPYFDLLFSLRKNPGSTVVCVFCLPSPGCSCWPLT